MPSTARKVFINTTLQVASRVIILLTGLVTVSLLTRGLGVAGYGYYTAALAFSYFFIALNDWGLPSIVTREVAAGRIDASEIVSVVFWGRLILAVPSYIFAVIIGLVLYHSTAVMVFGVAIIMLTLFSNVAITATVPYFLAKLRMRYPVYSELFARLATLALIYWAVISHHGLYTILLVSVVGNFVQGALMLFYSIKERVSPFGVFNKDLFARVFKVSIPLGAAIVINSIYFRIDAIILSVLRPITDVGIYGIAYKVVDIVIIFATLFSATMLPVLSESAGAPERFGGILSKSIRSMLIVYIGIFVGGIFLSVDAVKIIGGSEYIGASLPLQVLLGSTIFTGVNILLGQAIVSKNRQKRILTLNAIMLTTNIILNVVLIPTYGYMAAAWITLATEILVLIGSWIIIRPVPGLSFRAMGIDRILLSGLVMAVPLLLLKTGFIISGVIALAAYFAALIALRAIRISEIKGLIPIGK